MARNPLTRKRPTARRSPRIAIAPLILAATACTPACTPPADGPEASGGNGGAGTQRSVEPSLPTPEEMITEAKGVDLSKLSEAQRTSFFQVINTEPSACDKPHSLAKSLRDDATCRDSLIASQFVADTLAAGASVSSARTDLVEVTKSLEVREIETKDSPVYGNERAPVTVVVFADFECPHCRLEAPELQASIRQFRGQAKLIFKHFPLKMHPRAKEAAKAAEAAKEQGKFWEMHDKLFKNQGEFSDEQLRGYAEELGLDMAKFDAFMADEEKMLQVEKDRANGDLIEIMGTPAVFVNGREFNPKLFGGSLEGWIDDALRR